MVVGVAETSKPWPLTGVLVAVATGISVADERSVGDAWSDGVLVEREITAGRVAVRVGVRVGVRLAAGVREGVRVGVRVGVDVRVGVRDAVDVAVPVEVAVDVFEAVLVAVDVSLGVRVDDDVSLGVGVAVSVGVELGVSVEVDVELDVRLGVSVAVLVFVLVGVLVDVEVFEAFEVGVFVSSTMVPVWRSTLIKPEHALPPGMQSLIFELVEAEANVTPAKPITLPAANPEYGTAASIPTKAPLLQGEKAQLCCAVPTVVKVPSGYSIWVVGTPWALNNTQTLAFITPDPLFER